jgi:DnaJ like chaperone protein
VRSTIERPHPFPRRAFCRSIVAGHDALQGATMANEQKAGFGGVLREMRLALGDMFSSGKIAPEQELNIEVLFGLLGALARADSIVTSHEVEFVNELMDELKLPLRGREIAFEAFERGRKKLIEVKPELGRFLVVHPAGSPEALQLYDCLLRLAGADERLRPREREFLTEVTAAMGYPPDMLAARLKTIAVG